jgi:hypothetical protein
LFQTDAAQTQLKEDDARADRDARHEGLQVSQFERLNHVCGDSNKSNEKNANDQKVHIGPLSRNPTKSRAL